jgi:hypothetical protein
MFTKNKYRISLVLPAGPVLETVVDLVGAHVVDSQRVALVTLVKEGIARYTGYCQVHRILPGTSYIARYTGYCQVHKALPGIPDIARYTGYCQVHRILPGTPDIARYTEYCQVHRILPGTPDIARYTEYCQVHRTLHRTSSTQVHRLLRCTSCSVEYSRYTDIGAPVSKRYCQICTFYIPTASVYLTQRQVKVLIKNLDIFFLFPSKEFLPDSKSLSAICVTSRHHPPPHTHTHRVYSLSQYFKTLWVGIYLKRI